MKSLMKYIYFLFLVLGTSAQAETKISVNLLSEKNRYAVELADNLQTNLKDLDLLSTREARPVMSTFFSVLEYEKIDCNTKGVIFNIYWVYESDKTALPQIMGSNVLRCLADNIKFCDDAILGKTLQLQRQAEQLVSSGAL